MLVFAVACGSNQTWIYDEPAEVGAEDEPGADADGGIPAPDARPPFRAAAGLKTLPAQLSLGAKWRLVPAFPKLRFDDPVSLQEVPGTGHLFVSERQGRLYAFERRPDVTEKRLVLDLSHQNQGEEDSGLLGVAFHPEFGDPASPNRGYLYVHYPFREMPIVGRPPPRNTATRSRLSRFTVDPTTLLVDPASELVLIDQDDQNIWHQGGALMFHPSDGLLYLSVGDEGGGKCDLGNCQIIDRDLFSGVLRIDVDQRGGDVSHPIPQQPRSGSTANYFIPNDNPFVGQPGVLEEFYAVGLRNPHRMTYDPVDDLVWISEVGQEGREEIDILQRGANYQWNVFEGTLRGVGPHPQTPLGVWTDPLVDFTRRQMLAIIGGYVYRGERLPELQGRYIFADYSRGRIFALSYAKRDGRVEAGDLDLLLTSDFEDREDGITSFGVDAEGELYLLTLGAASQIQRLEQNETPLNVPSLLSEVGVFADLAELEPAAGFAEYSVQSPLWSDGADKRRWLAVPEGEQVTFAPSGPWQFPDGTVLMKHFALALDEREPSRLTPLETRLLVAGEGGAFYGVTYKWNADASDAELVTDDILERLEVTAADGSVRFQSYQYPGPSDCLSCHNAQAGHVLGVRTLQLDAGAGAEAQHASPLLRWSEAGWLRDAPDAAELAAYPRLSALGDETRSLEERLRSYWEGNCSMCHGVRTNIRAKWDARYETPLELKGLIGAAVETAGAESKLLVAPGAPLSSALFERSATLAEGLRMPPLGSHVRDEAYLAVLQRWISELAAAPSGGE